MHPAYIPLLARLYKNADETNRVIQGILNIEGKPEGISEQLARLEEINLRIIAALEARK